LKLGGQARQGGGKLEKEEKKPKRNETKRNEKKKFEKIPGD
jgi:hypothetical protein